MWEDVISTEIPWSPNVWTCNLHWDFVVVTGSLHCWMCRVHCQGVRKRRSCQLHQGADGWFLSNVVPSCSKMSQQFPYGLLCSFVFLYVPRNKNIPFLYEVAFIWTLKKIDQKYMFKKSKQTTISNKVLKYQCVNSQRWFLLHLSKHYFKALLPSKLFFWHGSLGL